MNGELVDRVALRVRHNAAMGLVGQIRDLGARELLLADVVWPSHSLERVSLAAAEEILRRREERHGRRYAA